jgi:hypothetical protein
VARPENQGPTKGLGIKGALNLFVAFKIKSFQAAFALL